MPVADAARAHGVDNVRVIAGRAPEALIDLEPPDAVFIGGSKGSMADIIDVVLDDGILGTRFAAPNRVGFLLQSLRQSGRSLIFISHFLDDILAVSDTVTIFRNGRKIVNARRRLHGTFP